jgi:hypothetical protein
MLGCGIDFNVAKMEVVARSTFYLATAFGPVRVVASIPNPPGKPNLIIIS